MRRIILLLTVAAMVAAVMVVTSAAPAFAAKGKAWGWGANPELCEPYSDPGCGFAYGKK
jgi:hypothetical protein